MINLLWTSFYGKSPIPAWDWTRPIPEDLYILSKEGMEISETLIETKDPHIRGWLAEAATKLALQSTYRNEILKIDSQNTYEIPLIGKTANLNIADGWVVNIIKAETNDKEYNRKYKVDIDTATGNYTVQTSREEFTGQCIRDGEMFYNIDLDAEINVDIRIPVGSINPTTSFSVKGHILPSLPAFYYLEKGLQKLEKERPIILQEGPLYNRLGQVAMYLLKVNGWAK